jgi:cytochrome b
MNTPSVSRAEEQPTQPPQLTQPIGLDGAHTDRPRRALVWDAPVRVFHWLTVLCFGGAWLTAESEHWRLVHVTLGYTLAGLVLFRLVWGVIGTRHARFASFVRGPAAVLAYLRSLTEARPQHHLGHNPAGALAIVALLGLALALTASGWATYNDLGGDWLGEAHEAVASLMLALVGLHVVAVFTSSWLHGERLVAAMVTGRKPGRPQDGASSAWASVAALLLAAVLGFWWLQWQGAPGAAGDEVVAGNVAPAQAARAASTARAGGGSGGGTESMLPRVAKAAPAGQHHGHRPGRDDDHDDN